ncbi:hypothetical protein DIPPA_08427 [Diplonema papillatum]|nr:hypothetical protein DIPPA_08427 [Diplonema papillatum]
MYALLRLVRHLVNEGITNCRVRVGVDSTVVIGAWRRKYCADGLILAMICTALGLAESAGLLIEL